MALGQRVGVVHAQDAPRRRLTGRPPLSWAVCPPRPLLPTVHPAAALVSLHTTRMGTEEIPASSPVSQGAPAPRAAIARALTETGFSPPQASGIHPQRLGAFSLGLSPS